MSHKEFDKFVESQHSRAITNSVGSQERLKQWSVARQSFFDRVVKFLQSYVTAGKIEITFSDKSIVEDLLGEYVVQVATIRVGASLIRLLPIGANIIGAKGRIDMSGPNAVVRFILVPEELVAPGTEMPAVRAGRAGQKNRERLAWKIATSPPNVEFLPFNEETFFDALMEVADG
ncbi:MAG: hypothetical protein WC028_16690 [Candidatus Obscuribacterales bacterium]|jgi:hypothetical protein